MIFQTADLESLGRFGLKIALWLLFMKFVNRNKLNMPIMNTFIGIDYLTINLKFAKFDPKTEMYSNFHEIWHLEQN